LQIGCKLRWARFLYKIIQFDHNIFFKYFFNFYVVKTCSTFCTRFQILHFSKKLIWSNQLHVDYKSHATQPTITMYSTKILKALKFLCAYYHLEVHNSKWNAFMFHLITLRTTFLTSFMAYWIICYLCFETWIYNYNWNSRPTHHACRM